MLTFLIGVASRVYALFGYLWQRVVDAANNALNWAKAEAAKALAAARTWAWDRVQDLRAWASGWFDWFKAVVPDWIQSAKDWAWSQINAVRAWAVGWIEWLRGQISAGIDAAKDWALEQILYVRAGLLILTTAINVRINGVLSLVNPWKPLLDSLIALFSPENLNRLSLLLSGFFPMLLTILTAPLAWLYSTISGSFVSFFCWIMASMMGTTKYTLPPPPDWLSGAGGPFTPGPPGPDPSGGELSSPLNSLRISGYHFGPGHPGLDLGLAGGDPVYAMHDGEVEVAGWSTVGYGETITLRGGQWWTRYAHLQSFGVGKGDTVKQGQKIAQGDTTGNSTGNHLHLEIKKNGVFIDPEAVLF
jgi:murein DD-endopeptidase MepM/ murein hydrolase activator NlpD